MSDDTQWLKPDEIRAWLAVASLLEVLPAVLNSQLKSDIGINHFEYMLLAGLSESPNRSTPMSDLAAFAAGSISRVSHALTRMENRGWVRRCAREGIGGQLTVVLTDDGMDVVRQAAPGHVTQVRELVVDRLGTERTIEFGRMAEAILKQVNPIGYKLITERYP
ncbi:MarR family winged helix-turn-helix transcriptional regulator [Rhodococcus globerulus]|uniref:MarR family transcriptional regulator n=1 Tax=Rhodococcus globerulus TaxID=33008 RepID=A0ABU4C4M4_RHOGO|nr:MarR family transcriptional regulator [Rhodococcus globerulus]MDV6271468.1 MarR family transcriptional regulator [Rhodococcus globerulus]